MRTNKTIPFFSIICPVYNAELCIINTINSVINQTYSDWELILVDDCSTDNSWDIIYNISMDYCNIYSYKLPKNSGSAKIPIDVGIKKSNGRYCVILGDDDELDCEFLFLAKKRISMTNADVVIATCLIKDINTKDVINILPDLSKKSTYTGNEACLLTIPRWRIAGNGMLFKKQLYDNVIKENPYSYMNADELSTRIILVHAQKVAFSDSKYIYWQHALSITHKQSVKLFEVLYIYGVLVGFTEMYYGKNVVQCQYDYFLSSLIVLQKKYFKTFYLYTIKERHLINNIISDNYVTLLKYKRYCNTNKKNIFSLNIFIFRFICLILSVFK